MYALTGKDGRVSACAGVKVLQLRECWLQRAPHHGRVVHEAPIVWIILVCLGSLQAHHVCQPCCMINVCPEQQASKGKSIGSCVLRELTGW